MNKMLLLQYKALDRKIDPNQSGFMLDMWNFIPRTNIRENTAHPDIHFLPDNLIIRNDMLYYRIPITCGPVTVACIHRPLLRISSKQELIALNDNVNRFTELSDAILAVLMNYEREIWNETKIIEYCLPDSIFKFIDIERAAWKALYQTISILRKDE